jgi:hypothetical protein
MAVLKVKTGLCCDKLLKIVLIKDDASWPSKWEKRETVGMGSLQNLHEKKKSCGFSVPRVKTRQLLVPESWGNKAPRQPHGT